jgi:hypothetical protein
VAPYSFDPKAVGTGIGQYYTNAMAAQPGYTDILRNISGVLSPQAKYEIGQGAAERGIGIGSYGGANDASGLLRALGLSSQGLTDKGIDQYGKAYSAVPTINTSTLYMSPEQREQIRLQWEMQQARLASDAKLQEDRLAMEERLGRISQQTTFGTTASQLNAGREVFDINRADQAKYRAIFANQAAGQMAQSDTISGQLADLASRLSGGGESNPWTGGGGSPSDAWSEPWRIPFPAASNPEPTEGPAYNDYGIPNYWDVLPGATSSWEAPPGATSSWEADEAQG